MFLPSGTDSPSYATASAQERKRGRFCLLYREQERPLRSVRPRPTVDLGFTVPGGSVHKQIVTTTAHWMMWFFGIIGGNLYSLIFATNNWLFYVAIRKQM